MQIIISVSLFALALLCPIMVVHCSWSPDLGNTPNPTSTSPSDNEVEPPQSEETWNSKSESDVPKMTTLEMLDYFKYPNEKHTITTEDGYILEIHRIPNPGQPPILLCHGVLASSADFLVLGPNRSLALLLHGHKYDVWLFNYRGNRYSRKHVSLNPNAGPKFWQYSMHEIAVFDLRATVDHIVNTTGHERLYYSGHSMGTMIFWVLLSEQPQYNDRFHYMQALAPVAFLGNLRSALLKNVVKTMDTLEVLFAMNGMFELFPHDYQKSAFKDLCLATLSNVCFPVMDDAVGVGVGALNKTVLTRVFGHFPAGSSLKQFAHVAQLVKSRRFAKYDYGAADNVRLYGSVVPPSYSLKNCRVPISLHYGTQDGIVAVKDVELLAKNLDTVKEMNEIFGYNHLDFLYSFESTDGLYKFMLRTFNDHRRTVGVGGEQDGY